MMNMSVGTEAINNLGKEIVAIGALGTAAFGLVDSFKSLPGGGISRSGFKFIRAAIVQLTPLVPSLEKTELSRDSILYALLSQWINGVDKGNQISIAKSLIKLRLTPDTAPDLARIIGVDSKTLIDIATSIQAGTTLTQEQISVYGRFDLLLSTMLDQAYQRADQRYRNAARTAAIPVAIVLAVVAAYFFVGQAKFNGEVAFLAVLMGLISTPIAPVAKDIASAISTAAQAFQFGKK
jgi:hypothetical protein